MDYGLGFDQPKTIDLLVSQSILSNNNSWKASCLLCILIQDYPSLKAQVSRSLMKVPKEIYSVLSNIKHYTLACYMVELLSQLDNRILLDMVLGRDTPFPQDSFANDEACVMFLSSSTFDPSIFRFESLTVGETVKSGVSFCQVTSQYFIVLVESNEFTTPIQFDLKEIKNIMQNTSTIRFHLPYSPTKSLLNDPIPDLSVVTIVFSDEKQASSFMDALGKVATEQIMTSTPRKISVVSNYIALTSNAYDQTTEDQADEISGAQEQPHASSSGIDETESMFGSPLNTTKDTSMSAKKHGRAISLIVAESTRETIKQEAKLQVKDSQPCFNSSSFPSNSLDVALKNIKEEKRNEIIESSSQVKKELGGHEISSDIWDFESDDDAAVSNKTPSVKTKYRSKAMKCLNNLSKKGIDSNIQPKKISAKKYIKPTGSKTAKLNIPMKIEGKTSSKAEVSSSLDMNDGTFSDQTSPTIHAQRRASIRAQSLAPDNSEFTPGDEEDEAIVDVLPKKRQTRAVKRALEADRTNKEQQPPKQRKVGKSKTPVLGRTNKSTKSSPKGNNRTSLTQIFQSTGEEAIEGNDRIGFGEAEGEPSNFKVPTKPVKEARKLPARTEKPLDTLKRNDKATKRDQDMPLDPDKTSIAAPSKEGSTNADVSSTDQAKRNPDMGTRNDQFNFRLHAVETPAAKPVSAPLADALLSEAYTNTLQRQIYNSIATFSDQLVKKIHIINEEINKKVLNDLTNKYETLFNNLRLSFQSDVDEMCVFITDVKKLLNLPEEELIKYIKTKKIGMTPINSEQ